MLPSSCPLSVLSLSVFPTFFSCSIIRFKPYGIIYVGCHHSFLMSSGSGLLRVLLTLCCTLALVAAESEDVAGPVVSLEPVSASSSPPPAPPNATASIAEVLDKALTKEFESETKKEKTEKGKSFNETKSKDEVCATSSFGGPRHWCDTVMAHHPESLAQTMLETVVRISSKEKDVAMSTPAVAGSNSSTPDHTGEKEKEHQQTTTKQLSDKVETAVDRIIDSRDNEFVLSRAGESIASLTLDPQVCVGTGQD